MRVLSSALSLSVCLAVFPFSLNGQDLEPLLKDLESGDSGARSRAAEKARPLGWKAVKPLAKLLSTGNRSTVVSVKVALRGIADHAARPGAEKERAALAEALAEAYSSTERVEARDIIAEILSTVGGKEEVPVLAAMLKDPQAREMARFALERFTATEAAQALREALEGEKDPAFQEALINSLAAKGDLPAVDLVGGFLKSREEDVRLAAVEALGRLSGGKYAGVIFEMMPPAGDPLKARARLRIYDSLIRMGEVFLAADEPESANALYRRLRDVAATTHEKCAAVIGLGRAGGDGAIDAALSALESKNEEIRAAGRSALAIMPGGKPIRAIRALLEKADPAQNVELLGILGERNESEAGALAAEYLTDADASVRRQALNSLEGRSDQAVAEALLSVIKGGKPAAGEGAVGVLSRMPGRAATGAIADAAASAKGEAKASLLLALGRRDDPQVEPILLEAAKSREEAVRAAAYTGLGNLKKTSVLPVLISGLEKTGKDREAAESALANLVSPESTKLLVRAAREKGGARRAAILRVIGMRQGPEVVDVLLEGAKDENEEVRIAALEGLSGQRDPQVVPVLLEAAEKGPEKIRPAAVLGCLRFGRAIEEKDRAAALQVYQKALTVAQRREDKVEALRGIGRIPETSAIPMVKPLLDDRLLKQEAAAVLLSLAVKLGEDRKDEAVELIKTALPLALTSPDAQAATEALRRMGVDFDVARESGFITHWWLLGPIPSPENRMFEKDILDPRKPGAVDGKEVKEGDLILKWRYFHTPDPQGIIHLNNVVAPRDNVAAYAYTEVTVKERKRVSFKIGSDDSVVCWLNGERIHAWRGSRGLSVDQDEKPTRLEEGTNTILLKVLNESGPWAFCLRITDRPGAPYRVEQKKK